MADFCSRVKARVASLRHVRVFRHVPRGIDLVADIRALLPEYVPSIVFDVGANIGQSAREYVKKFPRSQIYCFEPVRATYLQLQKSMAGRRNVHCFRLALGRTPGKVTMSSSDGCSVMYSVRAYTLEGRTEDAQDEELVEIDTLDRFSNVHSIASISLLKIDTEGHDLEVLEGARQLLEGQLVDIIQVEAGMDPDNVKFVPFETFKHELESLRYRLFGIYEQVHEHYSNRPHLRRVNAVFISQRLIAGRQLISSLRT